MIPVQLDIRPRKHTWASFIRIVWGLIGSFRGARSSFQENASHASYGRRLCYAGQMKIRTDKKQILDGHKVQALTNIDTLWGQQ